MSKVLTIAGVSILALALVFGLALPTLAAPGWAKPWADEDDIEIVKGKVTKVVDEEEQQFFEIQSGEEEPLTIFVDGETKYYKLCVPGRIVSLFRRHLGWWHQNEEETGASALPQIGLGLQNKEKVRGLARAQMRLGLQGQTHQLDDGELPELKPPKLKWLCPFGEEAEFSDIEVGDRVVVFADRQNGDYLAERVLIIKVTTYASVSGTIDEVSEEEKTIIIDPEDGDPVTLSYNDSTIFILRGIIQVKGGGEQYAHAIYDSDNWIAKRVVVEPAE